MPLVRPFETSVARQDTRTSFILKMFSNGLVGYGECVAETDPSYSYETLETAHYVLKEFIVPPLLGWDFNHPREVLPKLAHVRGHPMAKTTVEAAAWDLWAKGQGISLRQALGGVKDTIPAGVSLGVEPTIADLLRQIERYLEAGYQRIKIKIKPGWDVETVQAVRQAFPDTPLQVDANGAYTIADSEIFQALDDFDLLLIEQPFEYDDLVDHAQLQTLLKTPVCLDESISSVNAARAALALGSCRVINIKMGRVGGLSASLRVHDLCQEAGVPVWCGGMLETGIGRAHNLALASLANFKLVPDISASARYFQHDIIDPPVTLGADGMIPIPDGPGIGVALDEKRVAEVGSRIEVWQ